MPAEQRRVECHLAPLAHEDLARLEALEEPRHLALDLDEPPEHVCAKGKALGVDFGERSTRRASETNCEAVRAGVAAEKRRQAEPSTRGDVAIALLEEAPDVVAVRGVVAERIDFGGVAGGHLSHSFGGDG